MDESVIYLTISASNQLRLQRVEGASRSAIAAKLRLQRAEGASRSAIAAKLWLQRAEGAE